MRQFLTIPCEGAALAATVDGGGGPTGILFVSGGTEIRSGAHAGMARLGARVMDAGVTALRFDRRGVGDSEGSDPGFEGSLPDIVAATAALRALLPDGAPLVGFGLCDGATALALHHRAAGIDALLLANPWVVPPAKGLPPPAAIRRHYAARLVDPAAWRRAITGRLDYGSALRGVRQLVVRADRSLSARVASALIETRASVAVLLAMGDATAIAFDDVWNSPAYAPLRANDRITVERVASSSHSFAGGDEEVLARFVLAGLNRMRG